LSDKIKITTNATLLDKVFINKLIKSGLTHIEVSLWTSSEKQEKIIRNVDFKKTIRDIVYLANKTPLVVQVNSTVCSLNYNELPNLVNKLKQAKKLSLHTIPLFETAQCREANIKRISIKQYENLLSKIKNRILALGLDWEMFPTPEGSVIDPVIEMKRKLNICFTCFEDPYLCETGELLACGREMPLGGVDASVGFEKAWNHPKLLKFRENMLKGNYPALCGQLCYLKNKNFK
jgi:MoaA/NifB/PqqE/SkfB family radical SAM enzyme